MTTVNVLVQRKGVSKKCLRPVFRSKSTAEKPEKEKPEDDSTRVGRS